jgi:hypothetical protein
VPGEAVRTGRRFLADGNLIEVDCDFLADEMRRRFVHILSRPAFISFGHYFPFSPV